MQTTDPHPSKLSFSRWVGSCLALTIVAVIIALVIPARFRFHGLFNIAIGIGIGLGSRWLASDLGRVVVPTIQSRWKAATAVVVLLAVAGQIAVSAGFWLQYRAMVKRAWQNDPTTMFAARLLDGQIATNETNGQQHLDQMQQLFDENTDKRLDALKTRSGLRTWFVKRVDKKTGINSPEIAIAFWCGEICLGCLAALFGFVRRPSTERPVTDQTASSGGCR